MSLKILKNSSGANKHHCNVSNVVYHGDLVLTGSDDGKIKIWKPDLDFVSEMDALGGILSMAAHDNVLYTCSTDGTVQSWDLTTGKNTGGLPTTLYQPQKLFVDQSSGTLWAGDCQGNVAKFEGGKESGKFELVEEIWDLMVAGNLVYTARDRDVVVAEVTYGSQRIRVTVKATHPGRSPFCLSGSNLCFLDRDGRNVCVHENDVDRKFPRVKEFPVSELIVNALASPGENAVYSGGYDSAVKRWDLTQGKCVGSVNLECCVNALACDATNHVYVARSDGVVTKLGLC